MSSLPTPRQGPGQPIQIVNFKRYPNRPSRLVLEKSSMQQILRAVGNRPIYLLSIAGEARQGKSFLLTVILNVLERMSQNNENYWQDIIKMDALTGFHFKNGTERETIGIWLWSVPFILTKSDGSQIAVMLMDTQGVFDAHTTKRDWSMIVGLSLLTSSCLIYNLFHNIQENTLEVFHSFVEFGMLSLDQDQNASSVFQKLIFLIRDWNIPDTHQYGLFGGSAFLEAKLKPGPDMPPELIKVRETIRTCFEQIECFLLPNPGDAAKSNEFRGALNTLTLEFQLNLKLFVDNLLIVDEMKPTTILNQEIRGMDLVTYLERYIELFNNQTLPKAISMFEATEEARLDATADKCCHHAKKQLQELCTESNFTPPVELKSFCDKLGKEAITMFMAEGARTRNQTLLHKHRGLVINELKRIFTEFYQNNEENKSYYLTQLLEKIGNDYKIKVEGKIQGETLMGESLDKILTTEMAQAKLSISSECEKQDSTLTNEALSKLEVILEQINSEFRAENISKFELLNAKCQSITQKLTKEFKKLMELSLDNQLKPTTSEELIEKSKRCEEWVMEKFHSETHFDNHNLQDHFLTIFKSQINSTLVGYAEKIRDTQAIANSQAISIYDRILLTYENALIDFVSKKPTQKELEQERRLQAMEATNGMFEIQPFCPPEEALQLREKMKEQTEQIYQKIVDKIHEEEQNFQDLLDSTISGAVDTYTLRIQEVVNNETKIPSQDEFRQKHEQIASEVVTFVTTQDFIPRENSQVVESSVHEGIQKSYKEACTTLANNLEQAELGANTRLHQFLMVYEEGLQKIINQETTLTLQQLQMKNTNFQQKAEKTLRESCKSLPSEIIQKLCTTLKNDMEKSFIQSQNNFERQRHNQRSEMSNLVSACVQTYLTEMETLLFNTKFPEETLLNRMHENCKKKALLQLNNFLRSFEGIQNLEEIREDLIQQVDQNFSDQKNETQKSLQDIGENVKTLSTSVTTAYRTKFEEKFPSAKNETDLKIIHNHVLMEVMQDFEIQFPLDDLSRYKEEKRHLESNFQRDYEKFCQRFLEQSNHFDKKTRSQILQIVEEYKKQIETELGTFTYISDDKFYQLHDFAIAGALEKLNSVEKPSMVNPQVYEDLLMSDLRQNFNFYKEQNKSKKESLEQAITVRIGNVTTEFQNDLAEHMQHKNALSVFEDLKDKLVTKFKESVLEEYKLPDKEILEKVCEPKLEIVCHKALKLWEESEPLDIEVEMAILKAKDDYHEKMDDLTKGQFIPMKELRDLHTNVSEEIRSGFVTNITQTPNVRRRFETLMIESWRRYADQNILKAAEVSEKAIGIDLGTTYSCVAIHRGGKVEMIPDRNNHRNVTPSYVLFESKDNVVVGESAKDQANIYPENTIFDAKRLIGRKFQDEITQDDMKTWPFKVIDDNDRPKIEVHGKSYFPEEISAKLLKKLKNDAEEHLGCKVENAVITVPAYFSDAQKAATKNAGSIAGLKVMAILNEPTAAAIAYCLNYTDNLERNILVFDLGGGTFDISVLTVQGGQIKVNGVAGNNHLGGEDFDSNMLKYCIDEFEKINKIRLDADGTEKERNSRLRRIRAQCERQKINLSVSTSVKVVCDAIYHEVDKANALHLEVDISREKFNEMNEHLFQETIQIVSKALKDAKMEVGDINDVVLVGGSTRIPRVQRMLEDFFEGKRLNMALNPDEVVAQGAAILAAMKSGSTLKELGNIHFSDVAPISLGILVRDGSFSKIIEKNTPVPCSKTETYYTTYKNQKEVKINIYEGEDPVAVKNNLLGKFRLKGIPPGPAGKEKIDVTISCDEEGLLNVKAVCQSTGKNQDITIESTRGGLTEIEVDNLRKQ